jgi:ABC-type bacteriocin/lantibiotic exporter with double-glycine peptidase domain
VILSSMPTSLEFCPIASLSRMSVLFWVLLALLGCKPSDEPVSHCEATFPSSPSGCGPRALATIFKYFGKPVKEAELAILSEMDERGYTSMYGLAQAAEAKGFSAVGYQLDLEEFDSVPLPLIAHVNGTHFVVVEAYTPPYLVIYDNNRKLEVKVSDFAKTFSGSVLVVQEKCDGL